jgi:hypothetical protein
MLLSKTKYSPSGPNATEYFTSGEPLDEGDRAITHSPSHPIQHSHPRMDLWRITMYRQAATHLKRYCGMTQTANTLAPRRRRALDGAGVAVSV